MRSSISFALLAALVPLVSAHGQIKQVVANGVTNVGPNIYYAADAKNKKTAVRTMYSASSPAYVLSSGFTDASAMSCEGASGAPSTLSVKAGSQVTVFWEGATSEIRGAGRLSDYNPWVHAMGTVIDYIAPCNGDCSSTNAANLGWTKIAEAGLDKSQSISDDLRSRMQKKPEPYTPKANQGKGLWAMAKMVQDGSKWDITVPANLANGQYILRHELAALHNPKNSNPTSGPQLYIGCIQISVTGGGSATLPAGTKANQLYDPNGAFANYNIYSSNMYDFKLPGPPVWNGVSSGSGSGGAPVPPSSSHVATTTKAPAKTINPPPATKSTQTVIATSKASPATTKAPALIAIATTSAPAVIATTKAPELASSSSSSSGTTPATSSTVSAPSASTTRKCHRRSVAKNGKRAAAHKRRLSGYGH